MRKLDTNLQNKWHLHGDENSRREKFKNSLPDPNGNEKRVNQTAAIKIAIELSNAFKWTINYYSLNLNMYQV